MRKGCSTKKEGAFLSAFCFRSKQINKPTCRHVPDCDLLNVVVRAILHLPWSPTFSHPSTALTLGRQHWFHLANLREMAAFVKPAFLSDELWRRCLPALQRSEVMEAGSLQGQWDPARPLFSEYNVLASQALFADYIRDCLKANDPVGEETAIRQQLGINIEAGVVTFSLPQVLRTKPLAEQREVANLINRRYQPRFGCPWGSSSVDDVLRRSEQTAATTELSSSTRMGPSIRVGLPQLTSPNATPPQMDSSTPTHIEEDNFAFEAAFDAYDTSISPWQRVLPDHDIVRPRSPPAPPRGPSIQTDTPVARRRDEGILPADCSTLLRRSPADLERNSNARTDTPIARRQESSLRPSHASSPLHPPFRPEGESGFQTGFEDEPFEMPPEPVLDADAFNSAQQQEEQTGTPRARATPSTVSFPHTAALSALTAVKVRACSRCTTREVPCLAPPAGSNPRTKRPACVQCAKSHKTCDMRIVDEAEEQEYQGILDLLEEVEEAYQHEIPDAVSPWVWMLEATAKRLQEVPW